MTMGFYLIVAVEAVGVIVIVATAISVVLEDERNAKKTKGRTTGKWTQMSINNLKGKTKMVSKKYRFKRLEVLK